MKLGPCLRLLQRALLLYGTPLSGLYLPSPAHFAVYIVSNIAVIYLINLRYVPVALLFSESRTQAPRREVTRQTQHLLWSVCR